MYVKVSMDGAPYLRKIDMRVYKGYPELLKALGDMLKFTVGKHIKIVLRYSTSKEDHIMLLGKEFDKDYGADHRFGWTFSPGEYSEREGYKGSEYVPTYEDKDGDWMLVGDVPWE